MKAVRFGVLAALATAAAALAAGTGSAASDVVGQVYINDNTAGVNTVAGFDRHADGSLTPIPGSPFAVGGAGTGRRLRRRARSSSAPTAAICSPSTRAATRSPCSDQARRFASDRRSVDRSVERRRPGQHRRPRRSRLRRERRTRRHPTTPASRSTPAAISAPSRTRPSRSRPAAARPRALQRRRQQARGTRVGTSLIDSFTVGADGRLTAAPGSPSRRPQGLGPFGSEFRPTNPDQLFVSNAHDGPGPGSVSALRRRSRRHTHPDRRLAVPERPDRAVLGRDQPRRPVPVRRQHRRVDRLELLDRCRRVTDLPRKHTAERLGARRRGRAALVGRLDPLGRRQRLRRGQRLLRQRRHAHLAALADAGPGGAHTHRHRRHLTGLTTCTRAGSRPPGSPRPPASTRPR